MLPWYIQGCYIHDSVAYSKKPSGTYNPANDDQNGIAGLKVHIKPPNKYDDLIGISCMEVKIIQFANGAFTLPKSARGIPLLRFIRQLIRNRHSDLPAA